MGKRTALQCCHSVGHSSTRKGTWCILRCVFLAAVAFQLYSSNSLSLGAGNMRMDVKTSSVEPSEPGWRTSAPHHVGGSSDIMFVYVYVSMCVCVWVCMCVYVCVCV